MLKPSKILWQKIPRPAPRKITIKPFDPSKIAPAPEPSINQEKQITIPKDFKKYQFAAAVLSVPMYKRLILGEEPRSQKGEVLPSGDIHVYDEYEQIEREKQSENNFFYKLLGFSKDN